MIEGSPPRAVLDACVLHPAPLRDFLLWLATDHHFCPFWTERIHAEWMESALERLDHLERDKLERTRKRMDERFDQALISGYETLTTSIWLPDNNDRHILAAAIVAKAELIVTANIFHFPSAILSSWGVAAIHPDNFAEHLFKQNPDRFIATIAAQRANLKKPPKTVEQHLETLEKQKLKKIVGLLRPFSDCL